MGLSKALDVQNHSFHISKFKAYELSLESLKYTKSCVPDRMQSIKVHYKFSNWNIFYCGVPQGFFMFLASCDTCNYTDENTLHKYNEDLAKFNNVCKMILRFYLLELICRKGSFCSFVGT